LLADAFVMELQPRYLVNQVSGEKRTLGGAPFKMGSEVVAVAGIGNPQRFFETVRQLPYPVQTHAFPDHHGFTEEDFARLGIAEHTPVVMTEKDAVKCRGFAGPNFWAITIEVSLPDTFFSTITDKLKTISSEA
ncbi:MAG: tetraacyldisaccharide 4'-kinase, partial [Gammaproteobacteria bacterium]